MSTRLVKPRWLVKFLAIQNGYCWHPCPKCGTEFAGFEWKGTIWEDATRQTGSLTCCPGEWVQGPDGPEIDPVWRDIDRLRDAIQVAWKAFLADDRATLGKALSETREKYIPRREWK